MGDSQNATQDPEFQIPADEDELTGAEGKSNALSSNIAYFLRRCWKKRWMIIGIVFAGILISVFDALMQRNIYTSTTTLMPSVNSSPYANIMSLLSSGAGGSAADFESESQGAYSPSELISFLESRNVQNGVISHLDLVRRYQSGDVEDARKALAAATSIDQDRESGVITIGVTSIDAVLAANIAQDYVDQLNRVLTENSTSAARRERIFLEGRIKDTKQQLDDAAKQLSQFSAKSGAIDISSQTKSMVDEGLRLQAELIDGRSLLAALRQTYSEDNVRVRAQEAHNAELQKQLDRMGGMSRGSSAGADADKSPYPTVEELPALGLTYYDLERKVSVEESLWEVLTKEYEAAKVQEAAEIPTVHILDVANVPNRKSGPIRRRIVEIGAVSSLILGCALVFVGMIWEGMGPDDEPKQLITEFVDGVMNPRRRIWGVPGMKWVHRRFKGSEQPG